MSAPRLTGVPWPRLVIGRDGAVEASRAAVELLGFAPADLRGLERRLEVLRAADGAAGAQARPWARAASGEQFDAAEVWRDRDSGRQVRVRLRAYTVESWAILDLDAGEPALNHRLETRVATLAGAVLQPEAGAAEVAGRPSLRELLRLVVQQACELTRARYGALGVLRADHAGLQDFIHVGVSGEEARQIGPLPQGRGLLGAVIREAATIRVANLAKDPRAAGFPAHHPPMTSFLGVPLRIGREVYGNLYLTDKEGGGEFTDEDVHLLERFSAQAALAVAYARNTEEEQYRAFELLVQNAPYGIVYFPAHRGQEARGNASAMRLLGGLTKGDHPERTYDLLRPDGRPLTPPELPSARALREETVINAEVLLARRGGQPVPAHVSAAPVRAADGTILGVLVIYQDLTPLKELERLRQEFTALVAHDMRTPVQALMLQIEALLRSAAGQAATVPVTALRRMKRSGQSLNRLVGDLLDASRIETHRVVLDRRLVGVPELISALVARIELTLGGHAVAVEVRDAPPKILADPLRLEQIVTNLLENAARYSGEGSPIRVVVAGAEHGVMVRVHDQGRGIAREDLPRLFDRYFQARRAREERKGLGLGLYIVQGLVEAHGGRVWVESEVGTGSVFTYWLPAAPPSA
ncbi:MAG TPA: ATP-binding protein [Polyangia bacterium]